MNFTEALENFTTTSPKLDILLYIGVLLVVYTLFKEKLEPVKNYILQLFNSTKSKTVNAVKDTVSTITTPPKTEDSSAVFFDLIKSWKQTRDLAVKSKCSEAVKVIDQMFPYLSPTVCSSIEEKNE
jgi:hypothetical protein